MAADDNVRTAMASAIAAMAFAIAVVREINIVRKERVTTQM
jgi:hypothetical protein